jgi:hypothetical protein
MRPAGPRPTGTLKRPPNATRVVSGEWLKHPSTSILYFWPVTALCDFQRKIR